jgi:NAD+ diphosphatase
MNSMNWFDAAVFAEARSMVDWNARNRVRINFTAWEDRVLISSISSAHPVVHPCTLSGLGGSSPARPSSPGKQKEGEEPCASSIGLNNFSHPRTDPVIITVPVNETGDKILLGRNVSGLGSSQVATVADMTLVGQAKWNSSVYSALAGFMEPGEMFEDSIKRELWEEAGVKVWDIKYHSSQPWVSEHTPPSMDHRVHLSIAASLRAAFPSKPHGRLLRHG